MKRNIEKHMVNRDLRVHFTDSKPSVPAKKVTSNKVALCCMAKLENNYLREWVEYHLNIGFDHIFIYDNNETDGETCNTPVKEYIEKGDVSVVNYRGRKQTSCQIQVTAYQECYNKYSNEYKWIMFLDVDEFLVLKKYKTVQEYLSDTAFNNADIIKINWLCYSDNGHLTYENKPVRERFTEVCKNSKVNNYYKSFIRTNIPKLRINNVHYTSNPKEGKGIIVMNNGTPIQYAQATTMNIINHDWAYVAHYVTKSTEEFVNIKRKRRGNGSSKNRLSMDFYWRYNEKTPEKETMLKKLFK